MKKIQFFRNGIIYTPSNSGTALQTAKNAIMSLEDVSDGEIVLARYQEPDSNDIKTLLCIYYNDSTESGWTFIGGLRDEIEETEEIIANALSDLDKRVETNAEIIDSMSGLNSRMSQTESDIIEIGETIEENEEITAIALTKVDERLTELEEQTPITGIIMNGASKGTSGVVDLGVVLTEHQSLSSYADGAEYDSQNKLIYLKHGNTRLSNPIDVTDFRVISARAYEQVTLTEPSYTIEPYKVYDFGTLNNMTVGIQFDSAKEINGYCSEYTLRFVSGSSSSGIMLPNGILWANGTAPTYVAGHTYEINIVNNLAVFGEFY